MTEGHPNWYDGTQDFAHARFAFALRTGVRAARVYESWPPAEAAIAAVWIDGAAGPTWAEARQAVYHAWLVARQSL